MAKMGFNYSKKKSKAVDDDDYDYRSYGGYDDDWGYSRKSYNYDSYKSWNWGTYGYSTFEEDDDKDLFIKSHPSYFTPTSDDIGWKLDRGENTQKNRNLIKEFARYFYHRMIEEKDYFDDRFKDPSKLDEKEQGALSQKQQYYEALWDKFIPGVTPLEQAMELYKELKRQQEKQGKKEKEMSDESVMENVTGVEFHEEIYRDPEMNELLEMQPLAKQNKLDILNMISMMENLGSQFKIEKDIEEKLAHNSRLMSKKIMRDYSQLHQVDMYQRLLPTFRTKLLTKDLVVTVPIDRTEHKQKIIIMIDFSGSMNCQEKQKWVLAIMIDRLRYVMKEEAEVFFSFFVHDPDKLHFTHVYDRKSALEFWTKFSTSPNGGDTYIGLMIDRINEEINKHKRLCNLKVDLSEDKPEVLIINDGQDSIKTKSFTYKTNAITLVDSENEELKELCIKNKGKYVYVGHHGVKTYDQGAQT